MRIESTLKNAMLRKVEGTWVLFDEGREYVRLLDAHSREDAEQQISEMLFVKAFGRPYPKPAADRRIETDPLPKFSSKPRTLRSLGQGMIPALQSGGPDADRRANGIAIRGRKSQKRTHQALEGR